jgi:hypothetical protein
MTVIAADTLVDIVLAGTEALISVIVYDCTLVADSLFDVIPSVTGTSAGW